jgi:hypothetical protein
VAGIRKLKKVGKRQRPNWTSTQVFC